VNFYETEHKTEKLPNLSAVEAIKKFIITLDNAEKLLDKGAVQADIESIVDGFLQSLNNDGFIQRRLVVCRENPC